MFENIIRRGILTTVILLIVCVLGVMAAFRIPVQMIPDLDVRIISIRTTWPGATPQDVEKEILIEQEEYLRNLPNLSRIEARAMSGGAEIELEFPLGTDITEMMIRVNNALSQVPSYPENVDQPRIFTNSFSVFGFMFFSITPLPGNPRNLDFDLMQDFLVDNVKPRFASVPGISEVDIFGGAERQIQVLVDPERLAARELALSDVREAIRARNRDRSAGEVNAGKRQYLLRTVGRFHDLDDLRNLILSRRGDAVIRLSEVAEVQLDHFEKQQMAQFSDAPHYVVILRREAGSNVIDIKRQILDIRDEIDDEVLRPVGLQINLFADDVKYVQDSIQNVWQNLALGALLATAVMYLFLRSIPATIVGVMGIPICVIVAFLGLLLAGRTINVISLAGIAFAIGMTLDNSIVVLESIELARRRGADRLRAAITGVQEVWPAVFASTMTTVLVFLPVVFVEQEAGQLYSDIAIAISAAILASMLVAITILPTAAARLDFSARTTTTGKRQSSAYGLLTAIEWLLATSRRRITCIAITVLTSALIIVTLTPAAEYLPEGEEAKVFATMSAPTGYNIDTMWAISQEIKAWLIPHVERDSTGMVSQDDIPVPSLRYFNYTARPNEIFMITEPEKPSDTQALMDALTTKFEEFPGMRAFVTRGSIITSNDGGTRSINLDIAGSDLNIIYAVAQAAYQRVGAVFDHPRIQSQPSSLTLAQPLIEVHPNWERAVEAGMDAESLGFTVAAMTDGSYVDDFFMGDDKLDIYIYSDSGRQVVLDDLAQLPIYTPNSGIVPLGTLANITETVDTSSVRRINARRTVTLNIIPPTDVALETGVAVVQDEVVGWMRQRGLIPSGVNISISGAADQLDATRAALAGNFLVAVVIIYLLMVAIFNHWGYPVVILTTIPLGIAGGIVGLWLLNQIGSVLPLFGLAPIVQPFDMISMLGFLILMGTVVNNPILIVHRAIHNVTTEAMTALEAVREAVSVRLRPIAMSTITTMCGLAPLVLIPGAGTELYRGVGAIVMFGILGAAVITLTMLPALTVLVLQLRERMLRA